MSHTYTNENNRLVKREIITIEKEEVLRYEDLTAQKDTYLSLVKKYTDEAAEYQAMADEVDANLAKAKELGVEAYVAPEPEEVKEEEPAEEVAQETTVDE